VLKRLGKLAKLGDVFSAHSLRVGMAQDLVEDNASTDAVMQAGGWTSERMVARYTRKLRAKAGAVAQYHARRHRGRARP
jgi:hypothetical protein